MNRKVWSTEEKTAMFLEMIRQDESMDVICIRHGVSVSQADRLQEQFLAGGTRCADRQARKEGGVVLLRIRILLEVTS